MLPSVLGGQNTANAPPSLPSGLEIPEEALVGQQAPQGVVTVSKRRRKAEDEAGSAEPRRLRRSHEACARCRSKKIKASADGKFQFLLPSLQPGSATRNIPDVLPVQRLALSATRKTATDSV